MYIDVKGHHSGGCSFIYENDFCYYRNCLYNHRYKFSSEKEQVNESQQYIVSHPKLGSDPPFGSDRGWGRDKYRFSSLDGWSIRADYSDFRGHVASMCLGSQG